MFKNGDVKKGAAGASHISLRKLPVRPTMICLGVMLAIFCGPCVKCPNPPDEEKTYSLGLVALPEDQYNSIPLAPLPAMGTLPSKVDLSSDMPPVDSQGRQGSCVGWAVAYALKTYQEQVERSWGTQKLEHQFSPAYIYNQIKINNCMSGARLADAFALLTEQGCSSLAKMPYDDRNCDRVPPTDAVTEAQQFRIASWRRVNIQDPTELRSHLAAGFPIVIGMKIYTNFFRLRGSGVYNKIEGDYQGNHALCVVGYDDSNSTFRIINSWGTNWGDNGYFRITYDLFKQIVFEGYVAQDIIENQYTLTVNPAKGQGWVQLAPEGGKYQKGTVVKLTAIPAEDWSFSHWEGSLDGSQNPATLTMNNNKQVTPVFTRICEYKIELNDDVYLNGSKRTSVTVDTEATLSGHFDYTVYQGQNLSAGHRVVVGFRDSSGNWIGGEPQVIDTLMPDCSGTFRDDKSFENLGVPTNPGTYALWVADTLTSSDAQAIDGFKNNRHPTADTLLDKKVATVTVTGKDDYRIELNDDVWLNDQKRTSISLDIGAEVFGRLDYTVYQGGNASAVHQVVIGLRDADGNWVGGEPRMIDSLIPDTAGNFRDNKSFGTITVPATPGSYTLWVADTLTTSESQAIDGFKARHPTANDALNKKLADVSVSGTTESDWPNCGDIAINGNLLFVGVNETPEGPLTAGALLIYDTSSLANPIGELSLQDVVSDIKVVGNKAYLANDNKGLQIIDVSNPAKPSVLGSYDEYEGSGSSAFIGLDVFGNLVCTADHWEGLKTLDVSNPDSPVLRSTQGFSYFERDVKVSGTVAFVISSHRPHGALLNAVNVTDPDSPVVIGSLSLPLAPSRLALSSDSHYAYIAAEEGGLIIVDIADPGAMEIVGSYTGLSTIFDVAVEGNLAFLAAGADGIVVIDVSNPSSPTLIASYSTPSNANRLTVSNGTIYAACAEGKIAVIKHND